MDAHKRGLLAGEVPALKSAAPKAERPRRSFLEAEQIAAVLRAADLIEAEHRGLTWETVGVIRSSNRSAVAGARAGGLRRRTELTEGDLSPCATRDRDRLDPELFCPAPLTFIGRR
jgi:hypothetical protein